MNAPSFLESHVSQIPAVQPLQQMRFVASGRPQQGPIHKLFIGKILRLSHQQPLSYSHL
jgi:hypothetical protein